MKLVQPRAFIIGETTIVVPGMRDFLDELGASAFPINHSIPPGQFMAEVAGRTCYKSFHVGLNPNVKSIRADSSEYMANVIASAHGSVLEHATVNFGLANVSRILTHELVRHRQGVAISQESMRFVRLTDLGMYYPSAFEVEEIEHLYDSIPPLELLAPGEIMFDTEGNPVWYRPSAEGGGHFGPDAFNKLTPEEMKVCWVSERVLMMLTIFNDEVAAAEDNQLTMAGLLRLDHSKSFTAKKKVTSAMRRLAPAGVATCLVWTANHRTIRFVIQQRTSRGAEEEIRVLFHDIFKQVHNRFPDLYADAHFEYDDEEDEAKLNANYAVVFEHHKV